MRNHLDIPTTLSNHDYAMFGSLGLPEILVILVLALLIFGPKRLPEVGRTIGKGLAEFRRATTDLKRSVNAELSLEDEERPETNRRPSVEGVGRTAAEASTTRELPAASAAAEAGAAPAPDEAPPGTAPRVEVESAADADAGADSPDATTSRATTNG